MEALIIVIAEIILLPLTLMFGLLAQAMVAALSLVASMLESVFGITLELGLRSKEKAAAAVPPEVLEARRRKLLKRVSFFFGGLLALTIGVVLILNFFFFEATLRWAFARVEKRAGVQIKFQSAEGNLLTGRFQLKGATASRAESAISTFAIQAEEASLDLSALRVMPLSARIETVFIKGVTGEFCRLAAPSAPRDLKTRKKYAVTHLRIEDLNLLLEDRTRGEALKFPFVLNELDSQPFRSGFPAFDILFRSNVSGEIAGRPFAIHTTKTSEHGRHTEWEASELPVAFLSSYLGGPFSWLSDGTMDVRVYDNWSLDENARIDLQWAFILKNLAVVAPTNTTAMGNLLALSVTDYLRKNSERLEVSFELSLDEDQFAGSASAGAAGLWDSAKLGLAQELARRSGADPKQVEENLQQQVDRVKGLLNRIKEKQ